MWVGSGRVFTGFDVTGNKYRPITAIHPKPAPRRRRTDAGGRS